MSKEVKFFTAVNVIVSWGGNLVGSLTNFLFFDQMSESSNSSSSKGPPIKPATSSSDDYAAGMIYSQPAWMEINEVL